MTYCLALRLDEGLVFLSDTRTNAGVDNISTYRKLHVFQPGTDRVFVLQSAGNLATTQQVLDQIRIDLNADDGRESFTTVSHLHEAALYLGRLTRDVVAQHIQALSQVRAEGTSTWILGGQVGAEPADLILVYPEGNYIRASEDRPYLQIGESKYGKFLLDLVFESHADIEQATKLALGSMMSTARANLSVGPPYDAAVYRRDSFELAQHRYEADSPLLGKLQAMWHQLMVSAVADLPVAPSDE